MKRMIVALLVMLCASYLLAEEKPIKGQKYLADAQLVLYEFFTAEKKSVMDTYAKVADIRAAVKKDETLNDEDKKRLNIILDMNRDIVTSLRKGLDTSWLNKIKPKPKEPEKPKEPDKKEPPTKASKKRYNEDNWWDVNKVNKKWKHFSEYERVMEQAVSGKKHKSIRGLSVIVRKNAKILTATLKNSTNNYIIQCNVRIIGWTPPAKRGYETTVAFQGIGPRSSGKETIQLTDNQMKYSKRVGVEKFYNVIWFRKKGSKR